MQHIKEEKVQTETESKTNTNPMEALRKDTGRCKCGGDILSTRDAVSNQGLVMYVCAKCKRKSIGRNFGR